MKLKVFRLNAGRYLERSTVEEFLSSHGAGGTVFWVDVTGPEPDSLTELLSPLKLHPLIIEGCLDPSVGSRIAPYRRSLFIKLLTRPDDAGALQSFLSIICLPRIVVTVHESPIPAIEAIEKEFSTAVRFHALSASAVVYQILDRLIDEDTAFVLDARRKIESLEEVMDREPEAVEVDEILALKRRIARLSIIFEDQRHCVTALQTAESEVFDISEFREYFRDSLAHLEYAIRSVGRLQARLNEIHQHHLLTLQEKTNRRLRLLTIISAVFMPLTLIAGIYGMNFRYMPELNWRYGYPLVLAAMAAIASALLWIFHRKGWFR